MIQIRFTSPDYYADLPASLGGGRVVTGYEVAVCQASGTPSPNTPFATVIVPRNLVTPQEVGFQMALPPTSPSLENRDFVVFVREVSAAGPGPWGASSAPFFGGALPLSACDVLQVVV